jgi:hypothetical protein
MFTRLYPDAPNMYPDVESYQTVSIGSFEDYLERHRSRIEREQLLDFEERLQRLRNDPPPENSQLLAALRDIENDVRSTPASVSIPSWKSPSLSTSSSSSNNIQYRLQARQFVIVNGVGPRKRAASSDTRIGKTRKISAAQRKPMLTINTNVKKVKPRGLKTPENITLNERIESAIERQTKKVARAKAREIRKIVNKKK